MCVCVCSTFAVCKSVSVSSKLLARLFWKRKPPETSPEGVLLEGKVTEQQQHQALSVSADFNAGIWIYPHPPTHMNYFKKSL